MWPGHRILKIVLALTVLLVFLAFSIRFSSATKVIVFIGYVELRCIPLPPSTKLYRFQPSMVVVKCFPVLFSSVLYFNLAMHRLVVRMSCPLTLPYTYTLVAALTQMFPKSVLCELDNHQSEALESSPKKAKTSSGWLSDDELSDGLSHLSI